MPYNYSIYAVKDADGVEFRTKKAMLAAHGVKATTFNKRIKLGLTLREALDPEPRPLRSEPCTDHLGKEYKSIRAMCREHGVAHQIYQRRIREGWTQEQALTVKGNPAWCPATGPDGERYPNFKAMCDAYGADPTSCTSRMRRGMALEQALTAPHMNRIETEDFNGHVHRSIISMCKAWHVTVNIYRKYLYRDRNDALERACIGCWKNTITGGYRILRCVSFPWFLCVELPDTDPKNHAGEVILHANAIRAMKDADKASVAD